MHEACIMVVFTIEEPVGNMSGSGEACLAKERQRGLIVFVDIGIELMKMQHTKGVVAYLLERGGGITLTAVLVDDDDAQLGTAVGWIERDEIDNANGMVVRVVDHQAHLTVGIDVIGSMGDVIVKQITGIRHIGETNVPERHIVLYAVEQVEIFGLNGS